jgi:uncharacterized MAPEG superfamily protein
LVAFELQMLGLATILGFVQIIAASHATSFQRGYRWTASARDGEVPPLTGMAGRLTRTVDNYSETFPYFAALCVAVPFADRAGPLSAWGAGLYVAARLVYFPLYAFGIPLIRSLVWNVGAVGILCMVAALLWP